MSALYLGPLLGLVVAALKRIPVVGAFVARNPKTAAAIGAAGAAFVSAHGMDPSQWAHLAPPAGWDATVAQAVTLFAGAVTTHEVALDPVAKAVGLVAAREA